MKDVVIFGLGEFGEVMHFYLSHDSAYRVVGFSVDQEFFKEDNFCGLPVVVFEEVEKSFAPSQFGMLVVMGYSKVNAIREQKYYAAKQKGYKLASYISSKATVWPGYKIGENSIIFEDNTIQPFTTVGNNVVMWSGNHLGHHSRVGDHCFITSHVVISGGVTIGDNCFLGVNATIRDHIQIGKGSVIGMGVNILDNVPENSLFKATPAQPTTLRSKDIRI